MYGDEFQCQLYTHKKSLQVKMATTACSDVLFCEFIFYYKNFFFQSKFTSHSHEIEKKEEDE